MAELDPVNLPIFTLIRPFLIPVVKGSNHEKIQLMNVCSKEFFISPEYHSYIQKNSDTLEVQFRAI